MTGHENLSLQIERASIAGDSILMVGDFYAKLGKGIIKGHIHDMSSNGQKLRNRIIKYNLNVVISTEICSRIFTRVNDKSVGEKSVLDFVITSDELIQCITNMEIDSVKLFMPSHTLTLNKLGKGGGARNPPTSWVFPLLC